MLFGHGLGPLAPPSSSSRAPKPILINIDYHDSFSRGIVLSYTISCNLYGENVTTGWLGCAMLCCCGFCLKAPAVPSLGFEALWVRRSSARLPLAGARHQCRIFQNLAMSTHSRSNKLTWLVLGGDPAVRSRRVEQFTAL